MGQLLLIRHCESAGQVAEAELTKTGREQAETLACFLSDFRIDIIASSSYVRARQSIAPYAARTGLPVHTDDRLIERRLSGYAIDNWRVVIRDSFDDPTLCAPGGESAREVLERGWAAITELLDGKHNFPIVVTHGTLLSIVLNSLDRDFGYDSWASLSNPDVSHIGESEAGRLEFERIWKG